MPARRSSERVAATGGNMNPIGKQATQILICLLLAAGYESAWSQTPAPAATTEVGLEEITVTAQRRPDTIQRTPLAISALDPSDLTHQGINDARDLGASVPSVHIASLGVFNNVYINGVGGGVSNAYGSPAVSFSIDGVFIDQAGGPSSAFYDLQRLEVVKGPQGTLYGRNATAGALNLVPNKPSFQDEGEVTAQYGNFADTEFSGMMNIPLSDTVATRFAFKTVRHSGYLSNGTNDEDSQAGRLQVLWKATDSLTLQLYGDYFHEGGLGMQGVPFYPGQDLSTFGTGAIAPTLPPNQKFLNPSNPWTAISTELLYPSLIPAPYPAGVPLAGKDAGVDREQSVVHLQADWDLGFATATLIPSYVKISDDDVFYQAGFRALELDDINQYTVEARLASNQEASSRLQWVAGLFWFRSDGSATNRFFQEGVSDIDIDLPTLKDTSKAGFGQLTYALLDSLRLTGGIRYTRESKSENGETVVGNIFLAPPPSPATCTSPFSYFPPSTDATPEPARCGVPNSGNLDFSSTDYKGGLEYDVTEHGMVYANYSTGFKAGGFNPGSAPNTYAPERLKDYDVGSKSRFLDNRLQVDTSAFYWRYENQQTQAFGPINPAGYAYIVYPSRSHIYGASINVAALVTHDDKLESEVAYTYGVYDDYKTQSIAALGIVGVDGRGTVRPYTPKWTEHLGYTHTFHLPNQATVQLNGNTTFTGREYVYTTPYVDLANQGGYHKSNANLGYQSPGTLWTIEAFVNNLENKFTVNSMQPSSTTGNFFGYVDPPRTYGMRVSRKFQ
jgi:iron complex outermembrane recepter protein